jgi:L-ascorbate metabolism protein UlaG (beta-lactamase superfamily)
MTDRTWPRTFHHRMTHPLPARAAAWSEGWWFFQEHTLAMFRRKGRGPGVAASVQETLPPAAPDQAVLTWAGHASFVLQVGGKTLLLDPVWSERIPGGIRRLQPPGVRLEGLPPVDGVLLSHNHYDHLDLPTLKRLGAGVPLYVPAGLGRWLRRRGFTNVQEFDWWESATIGTLRVEFVPAHHWSRRGILDTNRSLWGGWVVAGGSRKVYFAGDTAFGTFFRQIGRRHPDLDLAILPIGAYAPRVRNGSAHTDPEESVAAFQDLGARVMVPMHWGTFRLSPEPVPEPMDRCHAAWMAEGLAPERLWGMAVGESRPIPAAHAFEAPLAPLARVPVPHAARPPRPARVRTATA